MELCTLKELIFAGTKFREFRGFWGHPQNLIPAKRKNLTIREIFCFEPTSKFYWQNFFFVLELCRIS